MTEPIKASPALPQAPRTSAPPPPRKPEAKAQMASDSFVSSPPTQAQLDGYRAAIAALDGVPKPPSGVAAKRAWLEAHGPTHEAAERAVDALRSAAFFHNVPAATEVDALEAKARKAGDRRRETEEEAGLREPSKPASPFRPMFGFSDAVRGWMGHPVGAVIGGVAIVPAMLLDVVDAVTRPLQALVYPAARLKYSLDKAQYEAAKDQPNPKP